MSNLKAIKLLYSDNSECDFQVSSFPVLVRPTTLATALRENSASLFDFDCEQEANDLRSDIVVDQVF